MDKQTVTLQKQRSTAKVTAFRKTAAYHLTRMVVSLIAKTSITPNAITWTGFVLSLGAGALIITDMLFIAGFVAVFAGFFDMLDGALARSTERVTKFGSILDSTLDRLAEAAVLLSLLYVFARDQSVSGIIIVGLALLGSIMVSYIRAKAEALGFTCEVGLFTRPERVVVLSLGLLLSGIDYALVTALVIVVVFSFITAGQRLINVWRQTRK